MWTGKLDFFKLGFRDWLVVEELMQRSAASGAQVNLERAKIEGARRWSDDATPVALRHVSHQNLAP